MLIPDVLALPLAEAIARLETAEIGYTVADTQPPRRQNEVVAEKIAVEYVVRQSLLSDNKVALVTVKKYRKEVLENGNNASNYLTDPSAKGISFTFEMKDIICCLAILPDGFNIFEEKQKRMCLNSFRERLRRLQRISK